MAAGSCLSAREERSLSGWWLLWEGVLGLCEHQEAPLDAEFEQGVIVETRPQIPVVLGQDLFADHPAQRWISHFLGAAGD
jgi:hypothetical protein